MPFTRPTSPRARAAALYAAAATTLLLQSHAHAVTWDGGASPDLSWSQNNNWDPDASVVTSPRDITFAGAGASTSQSTVTSIVDVNVSALSLSYTQFALAGGALYHTTQINDGVTLTITGQASGVAGAALYVGNNIDNSNPVANNLTFTSFANQPGATTGGTLRIDNPAADLHVRQTGSATGARMATLDLSKLSNFNATLRNLNVAVGGSGAANRAHGTLYLANNSTVTANAINVGVNTTNGTTANPSARLFLGQSNTLHTNSITIGGMQTPNNSAGYTPGIANGTLTIRGQAGPGSRADLAIGAQTPADVAGTSTTNNYVDLTGSSGIHGSGSIDAHLNNLVLGRAGFATNPAGTPRHAQGSLTYAAGTIDADSVTLGDDNNTANNANATGTARLLNSAKLIVNNSFTLGRKSTGTGTISGTLALDGASVSVRSSAPILDGGGTSTITAANAATLQSRGLGSAASPIDSLSLSNSTLVVDIGAATPTTPWGHVTAFDANGANTIALQFGGTLTPGPFPAVKYTSLTGAGFPSFTMAKQPARVLARLNNNLATSTVEIVVDSVNQPRWNGQLPGGTPSSTWEPNNPANNNWVLVGTNSGTPTEYQEDMVTYSTHDTVLFDDSAAGSTTVTIPASVAPNAIAVNNDAKPYTFTGPGKITGPAGITKTGAAPLTLSNTGGNDFTGPIAVSAGVLTTSVNDALPDSAPITLNGGSLLLVNTTDTTGSITVNAGFLSPGAGALTSSSVTLSGGLVDGNLGSITTNSLTVAAGASVSPSSGTVTTTTLNLTGGAINAPNTGGAFLVTGAISATAGSIDAPIQGTSATTLTINGASPTSVTTLSAPNAYGGLTTLNAGILRITHSDALGSGSGNVGTVIAGGGASTSALELANNITSPEFIQLNGRTGPSMGNPAGNTAPHIVNLAGNNTLSNNLQFSTGGVHYALESAAGKLSVNTVTNAIIPTTGAARTLFLKGAGDGEITGGFINTPNSETAHVTKQGAGTWTLGGNTNYTGATTVEAGTLAFATSFTSRSSLTVSDAATAALTPANNKVLTVTALNLNTTGTLDLADNHLIVNYAPADPTPLQSIRTLIARAAGQDLLWTGAGLTSSAARGFATHQTPAPQTSLAYDESAAYLARLGTTTFFSQSPDQDAVLVRHTYTGDATMDGLVSDADVDALIANYNNGLTTNTWTSADFTYDGVVNDRDLDLLASTLGLPHPALTITPAALTRLNALRATAPIPEPSSALTASAVACLLATRRATRQRHNPLR